MNNDYFSRHRKQESRQALIFVCLAVVPCCAVFSLIMSVLRGGKP